MPEIAANGGDAGTQDMPAGAGPAEPIRPEPSTLEEIIDELSAIAQHDGDGEVSVGEVMAGAGARSFGPMLLVPSLIGLSPIGAIPFVPMVMVIIEILIIVQMLLGWEHFWLPGRLKRRAISARRFARALDTMRPGARFVDGFISPRLTFLTEGPFFTMIAITCLLVAIVTPVIEVVPVAGIVPNAAVVAFSLALTARDGVWALLAFAFTGGCGWLIAMAF